MIEQVAGLMRESRGGFRRAQLGDYELHSAFQPIYTVDDHSGTLYGVEALVRPYRHGEPIEPLDFFARIPQADQLVADWLCLMLHVTNAAAWRLSGLNLFVNMHPDASREVRQICRNLDALVAYADRLGVDASRIVFEVTERRAGTEDGLGFIAQKIRALGCRLAVDDFGTSGSNLVRVVELEPDIVKIDPVWLKSMLESEGSAALASIVVRRLQRMGSAVLCEGVETPHELAWSRDQGVQMIQGHLFGMASGVPGPRPARTVQACDLYPFGERVIS